MGKCKFFVVDMYKIRAGGESSDKHTEEAFMKPKSLKYTTACILCLLAVTLLLAALPVRGEEEIYTDVIRLHIIAASDTEEDQALKLNVRDAVLRVYGSALTSYPDRDSAAEAAQEMLPGIQTLAEQTLREAGCDKPVSVTLTEEEYPTRDYETFSLPAGRYLSLRIRIGEAEGHNWWCVLYPPLCLDTAMEGESLSDAEWGLLTENGGGKYQVRFKVLEWLKKLFL